MEAIRPYSHPLTEFAHSDNAHQDHHQYLCAREVCLAQLADQQELTAVPWHREMASLPLVEILYGSRRRLGRCCPSEPHVHRRPRLDLYRYQIYLLLTQLRYRGAFWHPHLD